MVSFLIYALFNELHCIVIWLQQWARPFIGKASCDGVEAGSDVSFVMVGKEEQARFLSDTTADDALIANVVPR